MQLMKPIGEPVSFFNLPSWFARTITEAITKFMEVTAKAHFTKICEYNYGNKSPMILLIYRKN